MILLLFWVGGWVWEVNIKDQLSPIEIETGTEFGNMILSKTIKVLSHRAAGIL